MFPDKARAYRSGNTFQVLHYGRTLTLPTNIRLGWKASQGEMLKLIMKITTVKSFITLAPGATTLSSMTFIILASSIQLARFSV